MTISTKHRVAIGSIVGRMRRLGIRSILRMPSAGIAQVDYLDDAVPTLDVIDHVPLPPTEVTCMWCGTVFVRAPRSDGRPAKFCSGIRGARMLRTQRNAARGGTP